MVLDLWENVLASLKKTINKQSFDTWLKDTEPLFVDGNTLKIKVIDEVSSRHIAEQYSKQIESIIEKFTGQKYICEFVTSEKYLKSELETPKLQNSYTNNEKKGALLNPRYTFENFVIGQNNQLAHAAALAVSKSPGNKFNPLFIYGGSGLGKTHLMHAIGHFIISEKPFLKILYVPSEQFINEFIFSIRTNTTESFKIKYRDVDILLIDDIQFLEKKEETQNEFFHTFNTLYDNKKQVVISSDRPPKQLNSLTDRLITRFSWGMITDIQPPNLETREAILRNKAQKLSLNLSEDVLNFIARKIRSNIRFLEAALNRLSIIEETITINHAKNHLKDLFDDDLNKKITVSDIMMKVSEKYGVKVEDLISKSRHSKIVLPRFISMYLARKLTGMTTTDIGKEFGDRDHSTVVNAINNIEQEIISNDELKEVLDDIILYLNG